MVHKEQQPANRWLHGGELQILRITSQLGQGVRTLHSPLLDIGLRALGVLNASGLLDGSRDLGSIQELNSLSNGQLAILAWHDIGERQTVQKGGASLLQSWITNRLANPEQQARHDAGLQPKHMLDDKRCIECLASSVQRLATSETESHICIYSPHPCHTWPKT